MSYSKYIRLSVAFIVVSTMISCMESSTSNESQSSMNASSSFPDQMSSSLQIQNSSAEEVALSSIGILPGSSNGLQYSSSSSSAATVITDPAAYKRDGYTYTKIDSKLAGVWRRIGSKDSLHISDTVVVLGNLTKRMKQGAYFETDMDRNVVKMIGGGLSYDVYSFLFAGDTLYFNNPGTNYETFEPNPVQIPVERTDENTTAYLR